jgi:TolA-binding protein
VAEHGVAESIFRLGDFAAARDRFERLAREARGRDKSIPPVARLRQAQALAHQKKWEEAYRIASKMEEDFPGFAEQYEVDYVLGRCLANRAEFDKAREAYRRVIRSPGGAKTKTAANAQLLTAETYFHQKNYESALREYLKVEMLYAFPAVQAAALLQAGKCYEALGEWKQAAEVYARVVKTYGETTFAKEAAPLLQAAKQRAEGADGR